MAVTWKCTGRETWKNQGRWTHHQSIIQKSFIALNSLCALPIHPYPQSNSVATVTFLKINYRGTRVAQLSQLSLTLNFRSGQTQLSLTLNFRLGHDLQVKG